MRQSTRRARHVGRSAGLVLTRDIERSIDAASDTEARLRDLDEANEVDGEEKKSG
jgi:hypothetical protein